MLEPGARDQNRLQSTINNINIYKENLEAARSRIRDTDMAEVALNPQLSLTAIAKPVTMRLLTKRHRRMRPHPKMMLRDSLTDTEKAVFLQCFATSEAFSA
jgi:hypothetical protein